MKVRITGAALGTYWYADEIGEVFKVKEHPDQRVWKVTIARTSFIQDIYQSRRCTK
jgi:hypothetical protein